MDERRLVNPTQAFGRENVYELICPVCDFDYLHQGDVEVFNRPTGEDNPSLAVLVKSGAGPGEGTPARNPSSRRQGLLVSFHCENCHADFDERGDPCDKPSPYQLAIYQHKGQTFIEWRIPA